MLSPRQLQILYRVMQSGSITEAGRQLGLSQPAISIALRQLESRVGMPLFLRQKGRLLPTPEAEELFPELQSIFDRLDFVRNELLDRSRVYSGRVALGVNASIFRRELVTSIAAFRQAHPGVLIAVKRMTSRQVTQAVERGKVDMGITYGKYDAANVTNHPCGQTQIVLIAREPLPEIAHGRLSLEALTSADPRSYISYPPSSMMGQAIHATMKKHVPTWRPDIEVNDAFVGCMFVRQGLGMALLVDNHSAREMFSDLCFIELEPGLTIDIVMQANKEKVMTHIARTLMNKIIADVQLTEKET